MAGSDSDGSSSFTINPKVRVTNFLILWTVYYSKQNRNFQQIDLFLSSGGKTLTQFGAEIQNSRFISNHVLIF